VVFAQTVAAAMRGHYTGGAETGVGFEGGGFGWADEVGGVDETGDVDEGDEGDGEAGDVGFCAGDASGGAFSRVSGNATHTSSTASAPHTASPINATVLPKRSAAKPAAVVLSVAPKPAANPKNPRHRL